MLLLRITAAALFRGQRHLHETMLRGAPTLSGPRPRPHRPKFFTNQSRSQPFDRTRKCVCQAAAETHYATLGVAPTASDAEIKSAYRKLALKFHPDVNKEPGAHDRFVKLKGAYEVLSDSQQRAMYDTQLQRRGSSWGASSSHVYSGSSSWTIIISNSWDDDDNDDDRDDFEDDFLSWVNRPGNYASSFQSSWKANRKKEQARTQQQAYTQAQQAYARTYGSRSNSRASRAQAQLRGIDVEEVLYALGPEARVTAQNVFGKRLENLQSIEELVEFFDVMGVLQDDMGVDFSLLSEDQGYGHSTRRNSSPWGSQGFGATSSPFEAPPWASSSPRGSAKQGAAAKSGWSAAAPSGGGSSSSSQRKTRKATPGPKPSSTSQASSRKPRSYSIEDFDDDDDLDGYEMTQDDLEDVLEMIESHFNVSNMQGGNGRRRAGGGSGRSFNSSRQQRR